MKTTNQKNKTNVFSFQRKVFLSALIALFTLSMVSCQKEATAISPTTPTTVNKNLPPATPNIKYVSINRFNAMGAADGQRNEGFDINGDGINDFHTHISKYPADLHIQITSEGSNKIIAFPTSVQSGFGIMAFFKISPMTIGTVVADSLAGWSNYGHTFTKTPEYSDVIDMNQDIYAGIKIYKTGKNYFGWIRFRCNFTEGAGTAATITIIDAAYEQTDGFAIETGRKN